MELALGSEVYITVTVNSRPTQTSTPVRWVTIQSTDHNHRNKPPFTLKFTDQTTIPGTENLIEADLAVQIAPEGDKAHIRRIPDEFIKVKFRLIPTHSCGNIEGCPVDSEDDSAFHVLNWSKAVNKLFPPPLKTKWCGPPELKGYVAGVTSGSFVRNEDWKLFMCLRVNVREMPNARDDSLRRGNHAQQRTPTARRDSTTSSTATDHAVFDTDKVRPLLPPNRSANRGGGTDTTQRFGGAADVAAIQADIRRLTAESENLGAAQQTLLGKIGQIEVFIDQIEVQLKEVKNASRTRVTDRNAAQRLSTLESKLTAMQANIRELMEGQRQANTDRVVPVGASSRPDDLSHELWSRIRKLCNDLISQSERRHKQTASPDSLSQKLKPLDSRIQSIAKRMNQVESRVNQVETASRLRQPSKSSSTREGLVALFQEAAQDWRSALKEHPSDPRVRALRALAGALHAGKHGAQASRIADWLGPDADSLMHRLDTALAAENIPEALLVYSQLAQVRPGEAKQALPDKKQVGEFLHEVGGLVGTGDQRLDPLYHSVLTEFGLREQRPRPGEAFNRSWQQTRGRQPNSRFGRNKVASVERPAIMDGDMVLFYAHIRTGG